LRVGPKKVHELVQAQVLESVRLGEKTVRIKAESLDRLLRVA
jgi:excisionase family DNA binding protein